MMAISKKIHLYGAAETAALPLRVPVTLLSPLTPMKKGANALYIGVLAPCHP